MIAVEHEIADADVIAASRGQQRRPGRHDEPRRSYDAGDRREGRQSQSGGAINSGRQTQHRTGGGRLIDGTLQEQRLIDLCIWANAKCGGVDVSAWSWHDAEWFTRGGRRRGAGGRRTGKGSE